MDTRGIRVGEQQSGYKNVNRGNNGNNGNRDNKGGSGYNSGNQGGYQALRGNKVVDNYKLPSGYLKDGYYNEFEKNGKKIKVIKDEYILEFAKQIANGIKSDNVSYGQLRKFFEKVKNSYQSVAANRMIFEEARARVLELNALAENSKNKGLISSAFKEFIQLNSNGKRLKTIDDLKAFSLHFEAIVGFSPDVK